MTELSTCYWELVCYAASLCYFIPLWVFLLLGWQLISGVGVCSVESEYNILEFLWTVVPSMFVVALCVMNIRATGIPVEAAYYDGVLIVGNQWYWNYQVESQDSEGYDSVMLDFIDSVDKPLRLGYKTPYQLLVCSADVIHSFTLPEFNVKMDAIPGRVNSAYFYADRLGVFVGYCSELCGAGHAYMPIVLEVVHPRVLSGC